MELNKRLIQLGDKLTAETKELKEKINETSKELDKEIYSLYGLNKSEISLIEKT